MKTRIVSRAVPLVAVLALTACGEAEVRTDPVPSATERPTAPSKSAATATEEPVLRRPPVLVVEASGASYPTYQGSYCWSYPTGGDTVASSCVDSVGPSAGDLPDVGSPASVEFGFPLAETRFTALFHETGASAAGCGSTYRGTVEALGDGRWRVLPAGPPATYEVSLSGRTEAGEAPGSFRWTTTTDGTFAPPLVTMGALGFVGSGPAKTFGNQPIGFYLSIQDLGASPQDVSAEVTATASNGAEHTFDAGRPRTTCPGDFTFIEPGRREASAIAALGPPPITYDVALSLDGTTYDGSGTWPSDAANPPPDDAETLIDFAGTLPAEGP